MVTFFFLLLLCDNSHLYDGGLLDNYTPNRALFFGGDISGTKRRVFTMAQQSMIALCMSND